MEERKQPVPGEVYQSLKGDLYEIITIALLAKTEEEMVVYRQTEGEFKTYVCPLASFMSKMECTGKEEPLGGILYDFLDAPTLKEKLKILEDRKEMPDDLTITNMAISVDVVVKEGTPEERMEELIDCLRTMSRFECTRFR